ncbi:NAD-dependent succinate-semialdehyde dehydrogenase [Streptomyces solaniscabiei]|uniref:NAD-dependent succinate-semialdehyde dehydrogenase n=1 Tax=Streptomyces solaniscabiei TaxID=2683255 RepID=UPI001CE25F50|nr:aldehyde dehydrogenase family protein [Streptomyces solaniscabiei]
MTVEQNTTTAMDDPRAFVSRNPSTGEVIEVHRAATWPEVEHVLDQAQSAFTAWRRSGIEHRAGLLRGLAETVRGRRQELAELLVQEMGKPVTEALGEVDKCVWSIEWISENGPAILASKELDGPYDVNVVEYRPLGTILAIMPWNYPLWQFFRAGVPALLAGNCVVLKHAPNVSRSALVIEELFSASGFEPGVMTTVLADTELTERAIGDSRIAGVTLTGSVGAGQAVGAASGRAIKKSVLELGGSDPFIVLADADVSAAAKAACRGRMLNNGQSCIAAKRIIVVESIARQFLDELADAVRDLRVGDPMDPETQIGPLARRDLRDQLVRQRDESIAKGARTLVGARDIDQPGFWFEPTVLVDVDASMPVFGEETFGPLTGVMIVPDEAAAIAAANDSDLGLGASLWTGDLDRARELSAELEAGMVYINAIVASDARLPFGGVKRSGLGRELSEFGIREFTNLQTVTITVKPR